MKPSEIIAKNEELTSFNLQNFLESLPLTPGVYKFYNSRKVLLYVGKAKNLRKRVLSYFANRKLSPRVAHMIAKTKFAEITEVRSEAEALLLESNLIKTQSPKYNILFRDDKSYPLLKLSDHQFPRISFFRGTVDLKGNYFGPFPSAWAVKESIQILQKIFRLRDCSDSVFSNRSRPCIQYQIKRCSGPCVGIISKKDYHSDVSRALSFLNGKHEIVFSELTAQMESSSEELEFEKASTLRDQISALSRVIQKHSMETSSELDCDIFVIHSDGFHIVVNIAIVKGGRFLGDKAHFSVPEISEGLNTEGVLSEALLQFLIQYYRKIPLPNTLIINKSDIVETFIDYQETLAGSSMKRGSCKVISHPIGTQADWFSLTNDNAKNALFRKGVESENTRKITAQLATLLEIRLLPEELSTFRIECFDVSHLSGEATFCSCVVFKNFNMQPNLYRKFFIAGEKSGDDYAALKQALTRRFKEKKNLPELVIIDGGKGQVSIAREVISNLGIKNIRLIGLVKGDGRKVGLERILFPDGKSISFASDKSMLMLLARIRDEAHRFALMGMRHRRIKDSKRSSLDEIEGVGNKRKKSLLERFGGFRELTRASESEIASIDGISVLLAKRIYQHIHG
ncbi:MAG: excinuclease ABC subunit C [Betaproteobacteria bacterium TMED82]|nr:MAG: excinuclease ABC subunit C [Betaproteobacteria bacterium TMED82]|tara:strand:+ start:27597 stop:29474 length:1878 start_codon:yes stop_codon:yes gene_type:complete